MIFNAKEMVFEINELTNELKETFGENDTRTIEFIDYCKDFMNNIKRGNLLGTNVFKKFDEIKNR